MTEQRESDGLRSGLSGQPAGSQASPSGNAASTPGHDRWPYFDTSTRDEALAAAARATQSSEGDVSPPASAASPSAAYVDWYGGERRQSWATPPTFFAALHDEFGFTLDGASEPGNGLLDRASTAAAPISWEGERVFCNPPWSNIRPFVELAATADLAVLLVPARTNARWFHRALDLGASVRYFKPKIKFVGAKHVSPVDCVLLIFEDVGNQERSAWAFATSDVRRNAA